MRGPEVNELTAQKKAQLHLTQLRLMEAEGIEPSSRSNADRGLYMLISRFDLDPDAEHEHPASGSSRLYLIL